MKIFGIVGRKNSGKTGLTERLVAHFTAQGLHVATIKHAHCAAQLDIPGTDSDRHRMAGAQQVILSSSAGWSLVDTTPAPLEAQLARLAPCDLVLVEGYKSAGDLPKIECHRPETGQALLDPGCGVIAIATTGTPDTELPRLDLDDTAAIAALILDTLGMGPKARSSMPSGVDWLPVSQAQARLRAALRPMTQTEELPLAQSLGRVLAEDVISRRAHPPRANSAVDGYGFAHAGATTHMHVTTGRAAAGQPYEGRVPQGHALRIMTGAILPQGVDTVAMIEESEVSQDGKTVSFTRMPKAFANTRPAGEDMAQGETALLAGHRLRGQDLALAAALGIGKLRVRPRLRLGVLSTGDEIIATPGAAALPHQIWDANRPMLLGLAQGWDAEPVDLGHVPDDPELIRAALDDGARRADLILTSGGASAGDEDHVSRILRAEGDLQAWRIAMKPGRPLALAHWSGVPVIGLPGNPVAAMVCALIFARPAAAMLAGEGWQDAPSFNVPAAFSKSKRPGRREFLRARINADGAAEVFSSEGSGRISSLSWGTGLVELPDGACDIRPGMSVRYIPF